ncbi:MAG: NAD(P)H-dependent glycerol-3-phosphate dehydrogenase [Mesorhizobium sp.]
MSGRIAVIGGGAWGTALAVTLARAGSDVVLYARDTATVAAINERHENPAYLPGIRLAEELTATGDARAALDGAGCVLMVVPAQTLRTSLSSLSLTGHAPLVICAKGIESSTGRRMSEIAAEVLPGRPVAVLSGPSFATDVARGLPTAVTVAAETNALAFDMAQLLSTPTLRCYSTDDLIGVEVGGALKNVLAIAAGAVSGAGLGASAQAAIVTRGFVEMRRLAESWGARPETLMGLSGLGDLVLTCGSAQSRNFSYGMALGQGRDRTGMKLAEGAATAAIAARIAAERNIEAPITEVVARMLAGELTIGDAMGELLSRPLKAENE